MTVVMFIGVLSEIRMCVTVCWIGEIFVEVIFSGLIENAD